MKKIIYGRGTYQKDFQYVFNELEVSYYIDDVADEDNNIYCLDRILSETDFQIIICEDKCDSTKAAILDKMGLKYGREYIYAEDMFDELNGDYYRGMSSLPEEIVLWGTGKLSHLFFKLANRPQVKYCIDSNIEKRGSLMDDIEIIHPNDVDDWNKYFIVVAVNVSGEIIKELESKGLQRNHNFVTYDQIDNVPSEMMKQVMSSEAKPYPVCMKPFTEAFVEVGGVIYLCCPYMINNIDIGTLKNDEFYDVWKSPKAQIIRLSMIKQNFCFCNEEMCWHFKNKVKEIQESKYIEANENLSKMMISFDDSCNLKCISCRKEFRFNGADGERREMSKKCVERLKSVLPCVELVSIAGNGDPFYCDTYKNLWKHSDKQKRDSIRFQTNGLLLNEKTWLDIKNRYNKIYMYISIDAATEETYNKVRCGGNWKVLVRNMDMIADKRQKNEIEDLTFSFVVQRANYKELIKFIQMCLNWNADKIFLLRMADWGLYDREEMKDMSMYDENGVMDQELADVLKDPIFFNAKVDTGNLLQQIRDVEN